MEWEDIFWWETICRFQHSKWMLNIKLVVYPSLWFNLSPGYRQFEKRMFEHFSNWEIKALRNSKEGPKITAITCQNNNLLNDRYFYFLTKYPWSVPHKLNFILWVQVPLNLYSLHHHIVLTIKLLFLNYIQNNSL